MKLAPPSAAAALSAFLAHFDAFCAATGRKPGVVSSALFGAADRIDEIRNSVSDVGVKRLARAESDLAALAAEAGITLPAVAETTESEARPARPRSAGAGS